MTILATQYKKSKNSKSKKTPVERQAAASLRLKAKYDEQVDPEVLYEACKEESLFIDDRHQARALVLFVVFVN